MQEISIHKFKCVNLDVQHYDVIAQCAIVTLLQFLFNAFLLSAKCKQLVNILLIEWRVFCANRMQACKQSGQMNRIERSEFVQMLCEARMIDCVFIVCVYFEIKCLFKASLCLSMNLYCCGYNLPNMCQRI